MTRWRAESATWIEPLGRSETASLYAPENVRARLFAQD
jgi:hypothetical protein